MGYAFSTQNFIADAATGGPKLNFLFRERDIFVKKEGKWRLVHQHLSVPIDFANGREVWNPQESSTPSKSSPEK